MKRYHLKREPKKHPNIVIMSLSVFISLIILASLLLALTYIDIKSFRLPNMLTFTLIVLGLGQAFILGHPIKDHIIGALIGYSAFVIIEQVFLKFRGYPGLGRGDAKLLAGGGACLLYTSPSPRDRQKSRMPSSA